MQKKNPSFFFIVLVFALVLLPPAHAADSADASTKVGAKALVKVNCDAGQSVQQKINRLRFVNPLDIVFYGTCDEPVTISRNDVTLRGADANATFTAQILVEGSTRVTLKDFIVRDTPGGETAAGDGIRVVRSTDVTLTGLQIQDTGRRAISIEQSTADVSDVTILRTSGHSLIAIGSDVTLGGTILCDGTNHSGLHVGFGSSIFVNEDTTITSKNAVIGILVQINSTMTISDGSNISSTDNLFIGIQISNNASMFLGQSVIETMNNGGPGIVVGNHGILEVFLENSANVIATNNGAGGIFAVRSAILNLAADTSITDNGGPGILVRESSAVIEGTTATGNSPDVLLTYIAQANFLGGNTFGTPVVCNGFILTEGAESCPEAAQGGVEGALPDLGSVLEAPEVRRALRVRD